MSQVFSLFHLNLAYSSIEEEQRATVIQKCYTPLLDLIEAGTVCVGVELSAWTLNQIVELCPNWIERFNYLLNAGKCELIGSGYVQLIGPLVPYEVNLWNQQLGLGDYERVLKHRPKLVMVNEMAYSSGMVGVYKSAGYKGLVMDRNNICLALGQSAHTFVMPCYADGGEDDVLPVLWTDSILFQKFQRFAHGDIRLDEYMDYFHNRVDSATVPLSVYANDAEIFDFRPGRFKEESNLHEEGEWQRIGKLLAAIGEQTEVTWLSPSQALELQCQGHKLIATKLTSACQPIPVKKQAKYNVSRWAISGRNDLWINTLCHRIFQHLHRSGITPHQKSLRRLCEYWASDLRTHITALRWEKNGAGIEAWAKELGISTAFEVNHSAEPFSSNEFDEFMQAGFCIELDTENILLSIRCDDLHVVLNMRRGMSIHSLAFRKHGFTPLIGTLQQGYFHSIELGADFYSGGSVIELITEHRRITDLERVVPMCWLDEGSLHIRGEIQTPKGKIVKELCISHGEQSVSVFTGFPEWERPYGSARVGTLTLLPDAFTGPLRVLFKAGGETMEEFSLDEDVLHSHPASSLVSASSGLGGASGEISIGDSIKSVNVSWDPAECAAFPMLTHQNCSPSALTRITFSLCEVDETYCPGGFLPGFRYRLKPD